MSAPPEWASSNMVPSPEAPPTSVVPYRLPLLSVITAACGAKPAGAMNEASVVALSVTLASSCSRNGPADRGRRCGLLLRPRWEDAAAERRDRPSPRLPEPPPPVESRFKSQELNVMVVLPFKGGLRKNKRVNDPGGANRSPGRNCSVRALVVGENSPAVLTSILREYSLRYGTRIRPRERLSRPVGRRQAESTA